MKNFMKSVRAWFKAWGLAMIEARQESANRQIARMQLYQMTDRELFDIGITRGEIEETVRK